MVDLTPMVAQYRRIKSEHKDTILFFRLGDFYEMFNDDAVLASRELELTLTGRGVGENRMPMAGIPFHAAAAYIQRLIEKGYKVAICEQIEDPDLAKGLVKREVIRIYTPGTIIEPGMLSEKNNNYLMAVAFERGSFGIAYIDASTGEFKITQVSSPEKLTEEIDRINPAELLISDLLPPAATGTLLDRHSYSKFNDSYDYEKAGSRLKQYLEVQNLDSFGVSDFKVGLEAAAAVVDYLAKTQKTTLGHIKKITPYRSGEFMLIDSSTRRNLELVLTIKDRSYKGSLLWVLDHTRTSMGGRKLRCWIREPLLNINEIEKRQNSVQELVDCALFRENLGGLLSNVSDIERLAARIASQSADARDLISLKQSLKLLPSLREVLKNFKSGLLTLDKMEFDEIKIIDLISNALNDDPPFQIKEGGIIKAGFDEELDGIKNAAVSGKKWIAELEVKERRRTGIKSLKVSYNRVFGYYIDITRANLEAVPSDYIRKQTLVNSERFITPELKEQESLILNADERAKKLEYEIFIKVREQVSRHNDSLMIIAESIARLDVLLSLAFVAISNDYCKPKMTSQPVIRLIESRHPVVEKTLGEHKFVPNDVEINDRTSFLLITGPNMGGKSTYMRQTALICLMAQIGSFVPAKQAELCPLDRIFTRIGAMDDIFSGQSTFMLEMTETANILNNATSRSLIILDEIGRGTATFDGMSIAAAVAEFIHLNIKAKTMFATHYHEITSLSGKYPAMKNINLAVLEEKDQITFLHRIKDGPADKSYGIQVAKLAGLPDSVIVRSKEIYDTLEMVEKGFARLGRVELGLKANPK